MDWDTAYNKSETHKDVSSLAKALQRIHLCCVRRQNAGGHKRRVTLIGVQKGLKSKDSKPFVCNLMYRLFFVLVVGLEEESCTGEIFCGAGFFFDLLFRRLFGRGGLTAREQ